MEKMSESTWPTRVGLTDLEVVQADGAHLRVELGLLGSNSGMSLETKIGDESW